MNNDTSDFGGYAERQRALPEPFSANLDVDVFGMSHQGHVRRKNEDHFPVTRGGRNLETVFKGRLFRLVHTGNEILLTRLYLPLIRSCIYHSSWKSLKSSICFPTTPSQPPVQVPYARVPSRKRRFSGK